MKNREIFSQLTVPSAAIIRIDGRRFGRVLDQLQFDKPYDIRFTKGMVNSTTDFFNKSGINPSIAYLFSDEINLLFLKDMPFNGRLEKIDSIIPSFFSSALVLNLNIPEPFSFDSRVILIDKSNIVDYFNWRQLECWRNLMSSYAYYLLKADGLTAKEASDRLKGLKSGKLHELAWDHDINLAKTPVWQRRGIMVYKQGYIKKGVNPLTDEITKTQRYRVVQDWELPIFKEETGIQFLKTILETTF